ncbi:MAG: SDR family oxidoreductase [Gemmatimonadales bacterium]|nr:MAG: SDR family oxidoreductase [Gemmatimonadales bacterium]
MAMDLSGKTAVITGSTKGIGRSVAEAMVAAGGSVVIASRTAGDVAAATAALNEQGPGRAHGIPCDVRDREDCEALIEGAVEAFGGIDILVNNAGLGRFAKIQEMEIESWDTQIRTNLDGVFYCSRAAVPHLIRKGEGWIINIGSLAGRNAFSGGVAYNATKFGLLGMTEAMMLDLRHEGIRVTCIMPGSVNTHFFEGGPHPEHEWKLQGEDLARLVMDLLAFPPRALPSKIEIRPSQPPRK